EKEKKDEGDPPGELESTAPVIERVNPNYAPPPGTPDDVISLQNQIIDTLDARAKAEQFAGLMKKQEEHHKANEKPIGDMTKKTDEAIRATEAHERAVANRDEANKRKKENEDKARSKLDDYSTRAGKLTSLTGPMRLLKGFTGLASSLPDEPDFVLRFKRGVLKMNADSARFLAQLDKMDKTMAEQKTEQTGRRQQIAADAGTIAQTGD